MGKAETRAERNIRWIESFCKIPEGKDAGKDVRLRDWQKKEIIKIYDNPAGTRQAILSFPRKNGKTALISFLKLLHLCGPEAVINTQLYSAAQNRDQAATVFKLSAKVVRMSPDLNAVLRIRDTAKEILCPEIGTIYAALSSESATAHGKSPVFAIHDELGQVKGPVFDLYDAVETGMGAHEQPLSIIISTQAPTDGALLSILIDDALKGEDPHTVVSVYSADMDADPFSEKTLQSCNPAWGDFLNSDEVMRTMEKAKAMPSSEASYRNLHLNQRVEATAPFISRAVWQACGFDVAEFGNSPVYGGLDLSEVADLTSLVLVSPIDGKFHVKPTFWLPESGLVEKSRSDRVPYDVWAKDGFLETTPGKTIDYDYIAVYLFGLFQQLDIQKLAFDRWNWRHFKPALVRAGFREEQLEGDFAVFEQFGQGFQSISPALRDLEADILQERIAHGNHPVLTMCMANAVITSDPAGNRKLNKAKSSGRIDGAVALTMAKGVAGTFEEVQPTLSPWDIDPEYRLEL